MHYQKFINDYYLMHHWGTSQPMHYTNWSHHLPSNDNHIPKVALAIWIKTYFGDQCNYHLEFWVLKKMFKTESQGVLKEQKITSENELKNSNWN